MPNYIAKFFKTVLDDSGHQHRSLQRKIDINAPDRRAAEELSRKRFCEIEHIHDWSDHADELVLEEAEFPS